MLVMTLLVRNELDIVRCNIDFHLNAGVDHLIITDNASDDGTRDLLGEYDRLDQITVWDEPGDDFAQHRWVTRMALYAASELRADWIINSDADEFWFAPEQDLRVAIATQSAHVLMCPRLNLVCARDMEGKEPWWERLVYRPRRPAPAQRPINPLLDPLVGPFFAHLLPSKAALRSDGLVHVRQGNHRADYAFSVETQTSSIMIYHFPVRSRVQFEAKILRGGAAYARNRELPISAGWHWRRWCKMLDEPGGIDAALAEALPSRAAIDAGLKNGSMLVDSTLVEPLGALAVAPVAAIGRVGVRG